jgi:hypothetical protein
VGIISDGYGIRTALTIVPFFALFAAILFFAGSFFYEKDFSRVEKVTLTIE